METLIVQVLSGLIVVAIAGWLGIGRSTVRVITGARSTRTWKWVILISWLMIIGGLYLFGANKGQFTNISANNIYAMMGLDLLGFGIIGLGIGKVGAWLTG